METSKKSYIIFTLCFTVFGAAVALLTSLINYQLQYTNIDEELTSRFKVEQKAKIDIIYTNIQSLNNMVASLSENPLTRRYLSDRTESNRQAAEHLFLAAANSNSTFMQVRYLDQEGIERIRIDRSKDGQYVTAIAKQDLQDKSKRYYFTETRLLPARQFWHSKVDLNVENDQFEQPLRPTFRVATPLYNNNAFQGIIIINTDSKTLLQSLTHSIDFEVLVIDSAGEILFHPDDTLSWSRYLPERSSYIQRHPDFANNLIQQHETFIDKHFSFALEPYYQNRENLLLVMRTKPETLERLTKSNLTATAIIAGIVLLISFPLSWLAAMYPARLQLTLRQTLDKLRQTSEMVDRYVMTSQTDVNGKITHASRAFCDTTGYNLGELIGQDHNLLRCPDTSNDTYQSLWATIKMGQAWQGELHNLSKSQQDFWINSIISPAYNENDELSGYNQIAQNITPRKQIEKLLVTDVLTTAYNRRKLDQKLEAESERFQRYHQCFSVIMVDLDHFKQVNDTYGHQAGDEVLIQVAKLLMEQTRKVDCVGRWGGEEFMIICSSTEQQGAYLVAEKLRTAIEHLSFTIPLNVTASFGVAQAIPNEKLNQMITRADRALYQAKEDGRNRVCNADEDLSH